MRMEAGMGMRMEMRIEMRIEMTKQCHQKKMIMKQ